MSMLADPGVSLHLLFRGWWVGAEVTGIVTFIIGIIILIITTIIIIIIFTNIIIFTPTNDSCIQYTNDCLVVTTSKHQSN